jgi:acetyl esterase/lipase
MKCITFIALAFLPWLSASAQDTERSYASLQQSLQPDQVVTYKTVGDRELSLHLFYPENYQTSDSRPAFVTIHGGGWTNGTPRRFYPYAKALAEKGYVGISVEYRLFNERKGITVFDCVKDGRAAVRYIRANAKSLGIDPRRIAVSGGSAGGHVAAGTALFDGIDHADEDTSVSCKPNALVLFFPVIDTSEKGYGMKRIGDQWATISPVDQIKPGVPPTLIFHGDADTTTPYAGAKQFTDRMQAAGNTCELVTHPGGGHGYINKEIKIFDETMQKTAAFLTLHLGE